MSYFLTCKQNGRLVGAAVEGDPSPASGAGQAAATSTGGHKPAPFNLSHLEYTLPDTEIYEPETGKEGIQGLFSVQMLVCSCMASTLDQPPLVLHCENH